MQAAEQWARIAGELDAEWSEARLAFTPEGSPSDAAAALGPMQPVRVGDELRFHVVRTEGGAERTRNTLRQLDRKRIWGRLALLDVTTEAPAVAAPPAPAAALQSLAEAWDEALGSLPPDWSDFATSS
jgi:hypothetical protein